MKIFEWRMWKLGLELKLRALQSELKREIVVQCDAGARFESGVGKCQLATTQHLAIVFFSVFAIVIVFIMVLILFCHCYCCF